MALPKQARFWSGFALLLAGLAVATLRAPDSYAAAARRPGGGRSPRFPVTPTVIPGLGGSGTNIALVNSPTGGDGSAQDTNSIAISSGTLSRPGNPNLLIAAYVDFSPNAAPAGPSRIGVSLSQDNGFTWTRVPGGLTAHAPYSVGNALDPSVAADRAGNRYVVWSQSAPGGGPSGIFAARFTPAGTLDGAFGTAGIATVFHSDPGAGGGNHQLWPKVEVDNGDVAATAGNVYVVWVDEAGFGAPLATRVMFARLNIAGNPAVPNLSTFDAPVGVSDFPPAAVFGVSHPDLGIGPSGEVYVAWLDRFQSAIFVDATFQAGIPVGFGPVPFGQLGLNVLPAPPLPDFPAVFLNTPAFYTARPAAPHGDSAGQGGITSYPSIDVDRSTSVNRGCAYIAYTDTNPVFATAGFDIFAVTTCFTPPPPLPPTPINSFGLGWTGPFRVNDDVPGAVVPPALPPVDQFHPWLAVDNITGVVNVSWDDPRDDHGIVAGIAGQFSHVYYSNALNGFIPAVPIANPFSPNIRITDVPSWPGPGIGSPFPITIVPPALPIGYLRDYGDYGGITAFADFVFPNWTDFRHGNGTIAVGSTLLPSSTPADPDPYTARLIVGFGQVIQVPTNAIQFPNPLCPGTTNDQTFQICNPGTTPLSIPAITVTPAPGTSIPAGVTVTVVPLSPLPRILAPGTCLPITIRVAVAPGTPPGPVPLVFTIINGDPNFPNGVIINATPVIGAPQLVTASTVSFGLVCPTSSTVSLRTSTQTISISNPGSCPLTITSAALTGAGFSLAPGTTFPITIAAGGTGSFQVVFAPAPTTPPGPITPPGTLTIVSNANNNSNPPSTTTTVSLTAEICRGAIAATPPSFGTVCPGVTTTANLTILSAGNVDVTINSITATGGFVVTPPALPFILNAGATLTVPISITPTTAQAGTTILGTVEIATADPNVGTVSVPISALVGTTTVTVAPTAVSFGQVCPGQTVPVSRTITLCATGSCAASGITVAVGGDGFSLVGGPPPTTLASGACVPLTVSLVPPAGTAFGSTLTGTVVVSSAGGPTSTVTLTATTGSPLLQLSTSALDFGTACAPATVDRVLSLFNNGTCPVTIFAISGLPDGFTVLGGAPLPTVIQPAGSLDFTIRFDPAAAGTTGPITGALTVESDDPANPFANVDLTATVGTGTLSLEGCPVDFGTAAVTGDTREINVCNTGICPLTVTAIDLTDDLGDPSADFELVETPPSFDEPLTLAPGECSLFHVRLLADLPGDYHATLTVTSDDPAGSPTCDVTATIGEPVPVPVPNPIVFPPVVLNCTAPTQQSCIRNDGTAPFTVVSASLLDGSCFTLSGGDKGGTVAPGETFCVTVAFAPTAEGDCSDTIHFDIAGLPDGVDVPVSGTAVAGPSIVVNVTQAGKKVDSPKIVLLKSNGRQIDSSTDNPATFSPLAAGTYKVKVTIGTSKKKRSKTVTVKIGKCDVKLVTVAF